LVQESSRCIETLSGNIQALIDRGDHGQAALLMEQQREALSKLQLSLQTETSPSSFSRSNSLQRDDGAASSAGQDSIRSDDHEDHSRAGQDSVWSDDHENDSNDGGDVGADTATDVASLQPLPVVQAS
jgi:hypothetical protein